MFLGTLWGAEKNTAGVPKNMNNIYIELAKTNESFTASQIRVAIKYAIDNRNEKKSIDNFEEVFGYEYDEEIFTNKDFIEELSRVIN